MMPTRVGAGRRRATWCVATLALLVGALSGCSGDPADASGEKMLSVERQPFIFDGVKNVTRVAQLTGANSMNRTDRFEVAGQDLGSMFEADGKTWFVFGDTFGQRDAGLTGGGGTEWRSNSLAFTTDTDPTNGITFDGYIADDIGWAKEVVDSKKVDDSEMTAIPTYGFEANGAMYLDYMSVKHWGEPGQWEANYAGFAKSTDHGHTWTKLDAPRWSGDSNFVQVSVTKVGSDLYFWGVTHGRFGGVQLMRVAEKRVEDKSAYRYFTGTSASGEPTWGSDPANAKTIVEDTVGELSVAWNVYLQRWLMTYTTGNGDGSTIRESSTPWGPWGKGHTLVSASKVVGGIYAPFMLPQYTTNGGRTIYFTLSIWDPYNVFWYKADLLKKH